ncbi:RNA-binding protein Pasilla [Anabrus simplex]|uniref:RNA-binding protein Pasilla n=1 Tax=Anabrus simplex TaxID=316456 RepID=UPI0034DD5C4B
MQSSMATDLGVETCTSSEILDSRKRPLDGEVENGVTKKSHYAAGAEGTYHFKMLVPSVAAGAIIGKGGDTIAQLQKDSGARVKMSKANDFYPGTSERVCLITGSVDAIMDVIVFIMEKIKEKPDMHAKQVLAYADHDKQGGSQIQLKILVPNSTAGMIIGKGGNYIKQIKEESGAYVQISQKAKDQILQERCITVIGDMECNKTASLMILAKITEDPQSGACLNVSYADVSGPVANYNPTGSPYATTNHGSQQLGNSFNSSAGLNSPIAAVGGMLMNGGLNLSLNLGSPSGGASLTTQLLEHIIVTLRGSGYSDQAASEIIAAMTTLARYGILGMGLGLTGGSSSSSNIGSAGNYLGISPMDSTPSPQTGNGIGNSGGVFGAIGTGLGSSSPSPRTGGIDCYGEGGGSTGGSYDPFRRQSSPTSIGSSLSMNSNAFGLRTGPQQTTLSPFIGAKGSDLKGEQKKEDMEVSESIVGAILGPAGQSLVKIQQLSGANIQISKKGIFAPGTCNRIVTIVGSPNAIFTARNLIQQKISEEEAKRARQQHNYGMLQ